MALNFNSVEPTQIIVKDGTSAQTLDFPLGQKTVTRFMSDITGYNIAQATFTSTHNFTANMVICNGIVLNSSDKLIHEETTKIDIEDDDYLTWSFYASFKDNVISLEQIAQRKFKKELNLTSVTLHGKNYSAIFDSATDLTVLKYGTTAVWGKPFSLTIQAGANSTVTVNRTSSPNQHASTGTITSGGIVYYGDTLTITATPASGYKLVSFTINGTEYASGQTSAVSQTITVTSAVSIVSATQSAASWKTVWTGNQKITPNRVFTSGGQTPEGYAFSSEATFSGIQENIKTRITFTPASENAIIKEISTEEIVIYKVSASAAKYSLYANVEGTDIKFPLRGFSEFSGRVPIKDVQLTKVEQYY